MKEEAEEAKKMKKQTTLEGLFYKVKGPQEFSWEGVLHAVAIFVGCNQVSSSCSLWDVFLLTFFFLLVSDTFWDMLVSMWPQATNYDLPSTHKVVDYIHNQFVKQLEELKAQITVCHSENPNSQILTHTELTH